MSGMHFFFLFSCFSFSLIKMQMRIGWTIVDGLYQRLLSSHANSIRFLFFFFLYIYCANKPENKSTIYVSIDRGQYWVCEKKPVNGKKNQSIKVLLSKKNLIIFFPTKITFIGIHYRQFIFILFLELVRNKCFYYFTIK
jgi:hypothetical protein